MTYLETLTKLEKFATAKPAEFRELWPSLCMAQIKSHNFNLTAARFFGPNVMDAIEPHSSTPEERALEESLNAVLNDGGTHRDFYKPLMWMAGDEVGSKVLGKITSAKPPMQLLHLAVRADSCGRKP